ncbi:hypothetical protein NIES50_16650 [Aulosira laxa NIES-50]|nr:hypothetical protein NIES50_16650 [Aulosira laxa NIES-50]
MGHWAWGIGHGALGMVDLIRISLLVPLSPYPLPLCITKGVAAIARQPELTFLVAQVWRYADEIRRLGLVAG